MKQIFFIFLSASLFACNDKPAPFKSNDTAKIGETHGDLAGVASALHKDDPAPTSEWEYSVSEDKMTDKKTIIGSCPSISSLDLKFPYGGTNYAHIMIQSRRGSTRVLLNVDKGQILESDIHIRIDGGKMETYYPSQPGDGDSKYAFLSPSDKLFSKLKKSKHIIVEAELYDNGIQQMEFNTAGLTWPPKESTIPK